MGSMMLEVQSCGQFLTSKVEEKKLFRPFNSVLHALEEPSETANDIIMIVDESGFGSVLIHINPSH
jgi:hypothetical protein